MKTKSDFDDAEAAEAEEVEEAETVEVMDGVMVASECPHCTVLGYLRMLGYSGTIALEILMECVGDILSCAAEQNQKDNALFDVQGMYDKTMAKIRNETWKTDKDPDYVLVARGDGKLNS